MSKFDVTVIGAGPGGYVAAIRCAQLGFKTAIVERYNTLGGTCLNVGCIPSKALLDSSEHFHAANSKFKSHGINTTGLKVDFKQMIQRKENVVKANTDGINYLMKKNKISVFNGHATFKSKNKLTIKPAKGKSTEVESDKFIIATGSKPASLPGIDIDKKRIISSTEALKLKSIPKTMTVIGGGVIGLEMGSVYARLGTKVQVVEFLDSLIAGFDAAQSKELKKTMEKELGVEFYLKHKVSEVKSTAKQVNIKAENLSDSKKATFNAEYCLMAVGRKPYTDALGLDKIGVKTDNKGRIEVNEYLQTNANNIYAIGDVIKGAMLAHKAEDEGVFVAETLAGQKPHINYLLIPNVVYTWPEVASVGYTEQQLKSDGRAYKQGAFPFKASGRARASMDTDGLVKVLADKQNDEILGIHIIGPRAADLIGEATLAMEYKASAEDVARTCHAHPTYSEALKEACMAASEKRAIHI